MKTLRQRPTVVGRTDDGATIYGIRSVELVLPSGALHFKRLVPCAKCGRKVPGSVVLGPADLDRPATPVFCDRCGRAIDHPSREASRETAPAPEPVVTVGAVDDGRLAAVEAQLAELAARVAALPAAAPEAVAARDLADLRAGVTDMIDATAHALHAALRDGLDHLGAEIAAHSHAEIEETLARELVEVGTNLAGALTQGLDRFRSEMASLQQRVDESAARSEMEQVAEATRELAQAQRDLDQKVSDLGIQVSALPGFDPEAVGGRELAELRARVVETIGADHAQLRGELAEGLGVLRAEIGHLEQRSQDEVASVAALLEAQRKELTEALHDVAQEAAAQQRIEGEPASHSHTEIEERLARELAGMGTSLAAALSQGLEHVRSEMASLQRRADESAGRSEMDREMAELRARVVETIGAEDAQLRNELAGGLDALRAEIVLLGQRSQDELASVAALLDAQRKELTEALHDVAQETLMAVAEPLRDLTKAREEFERRVEALTASAKAAAAWLHALEQKVSRPAQKRRPPRALVESLEQQLLEAEKRLGQL